MGHDMIWKKYIIIDNKKMMCSKCKFEVENMISRPKEKSRKI